MEAADLLTALNRQVAPAVVVKAAAVGPGGVRRPPLGHRPALPVPGLERSGPRPAARPGVLARDPAARPRDDGGGRRRPRRRARLRGLLPPPAGAAEGRAGSSAGCCGPPGACRRGASPTTPGRTGEGRLLRFEIEADSFCHQMVRSLVALLVEVGTGGPTSADVVVAFLKAGERAGLPARHRPTGCAWSRSPTRPELGPPGPVDGLPDQVGVAGVPGDLLDQVQQHPSAIELRRREGVEVGDGGQDRPVLVDRLLVEGPDRVPQCRRARSELAVVFGWPQARNVAAGHLQLEPPPFDEGDVLHQREEAELACRGTALGLVVGEAVDLAQERRPSARRGTSPARSARWVALRMGPAYDLLRWLVSATSLAEPRPVAEAPRNAVSLRVAHAPCAG